MRGGVCGERGFLGYLVSGGLLVVRSGLGFRLLRSFFLGGPSGFLLLVFGYFGGRLSWDVVVWGFGIE